MSAGEPLGKHRDRILSTSDQRKLTLVVVIASAVAWLAMLLLHSCIAGHSFSHQSSVTTLGTNLQWLSGWFIMVVAMMLPPALPFLQAMQRLTKGLPRDGALVAAAAVAFIAAWMLAGVLLVTAGNLLTSFLATIPWLVDRPTLISGLAAIFVGAYQLSPLKQACLTACRTPTALMLLDWDSGHPWRSAVTIGLHYGGVCIGCCWTLMLLTLVVGSFVLPLMVIVSVIMLLERFLPSVRPLVPLQAILACAIGILLFFGSLPPGLNIESTGIHNHHHTLEK
jgi:predicted metal-binding membrane protein